MIGTRSGKGQQNLRVRHEELWLGKSDDSGERLLGFTAVHSLFICNARFQQKSNPKWTWESPDDVQKNMIDLVIIQK
jgi:hypothetical protein